MTKEVRDRINKRKIAYIYLLYRMFEGNPTMMIKIMHPQGVTLGDLQDWDLDYKEAVHQTIQEEDSRGVNIKALQDVPSIKSIKEKILRQCNDLIENTTDPSKLATTYKILSEFETADDKKEKGILDAINDSIKPLTPKKKEKVVTMLERMKLQKQNDPSAREEEDDGDDNNENEE